MTTVTLLTDSRQPAVEAWRLAWRDGIAPELSDAGLEALAGALDADDPRLIQGTTSYPPPLATLAAEAVTACCAIGFAGWQGDGKRSVGQIEEHFWSVCQRAIENTGDPLAARTFLNWWDDAPRDQARMQLLAEVELALAERRQTPAAA